MLCVLVTPLVAGVDYHKDKMTPFWDITAIQDWKLCKDNHDGVMSDSYVPGPLSPTKESGLEKFFTWYELSSAGYIYTSLQDQLGSFVSVRI